MPSRAPQPAVLHHICPHCGHVNIPDRTRCKQCRRPLGERPLLPALAPHDPSYRCFTVQLPAMPRVVLILLVTVVVLLAVVVAVAAHTPAGVLVALLPLTWFLRHRPDRPMTITLTLTAAVLDFDHPDVHIRTTWPNVARITDGAIITLARPAATRLAYRDRSDAWNPAYQRERTIFLHDFDAPNVAAIVAAIQHYAPHIQIESTAVLERPDPRP